MSHFPKNQKIHSHLIKQPSFKHSLMAALIISLGGTSLATWADENQAASSVTPTTASAPLTREQLTPEQRAQRHAQHQQERTQRRTEAFQQADTNHDGKVNLEEWLAFKPLHHGHDDGKPRDRAEPRPERGGKNLVEWLQKVDSNHDGQLTLTEWLAFKPQHHGFWHHLWHRWFGHDHRQQHQVPHGDLLKPVDTNGDGQISLSEAQANAPRLAEHFNEIDTDHNGQISQDERRAAFKAVNAKSAS